jgi:hypothetical protein
MEMDENQMEMKEREYEALITLIRGGISVEPPDGFTEGVMELVSRDNPCLLLRAWSALRRHREFTMNPFRAIKGEVTRQECTLYFITAGFAYMILAVVMYMGLRGIGEGVEGSDWLVLQPRLASLFACWVFGFGIAVLKGGRTGLRAARLSLLGYMEAVLINGVVTITLFGTSLLLLPFFWLTAAGGLAGWFLAVVVHHLLIEHDARRVSL